MNPASLLREDYAAFVKALSGMRTLPAATPAAGSVSVEPISFIVAVNCRREFDLHIGNSSVFHGDKHQWVCLDNSINQGWANMGQLYNDALKEAVHDLCIFVHQDVYFPPDWEQRFGHSLMVIETSDPAWGIVGCAGCATVRTWLRKNAKRRLIGHWSDPHGLFKPVSDLPARVDILDEMILGMRRSRGLTFDAALPGFHHYGADICLSARHAGYACYAVDAPVVHKLFDARGQVIRNAADSHKLRRRSQVKSSPEFQAGATYVGKKWAAHLPIHSTSHLYRAGARESGQ